MKSRGINQLLIASIALAIAGVIISYFGHKKLRESERWVAHSRGVIETAHRLLSNLMATEANHRSFILTGDSTYLSPYMTSRYNSIRLIDSLEKLVGDNPAQLDIVDNQIIPLGREKLNEWQESITILKEESKDSATHFLNARHGNRVTDSLWLKAGMFIAAEEQLLKRRLETVEFDNGVNDVVRNSSLFIVALASFLALRTIRRQQLQNDVLVDGLKNLNLDLERRINERTGDLQHKNALAEKLNEELQQRNSEVMTLHEGLKIRNKHNEESLQEVRDLYDNAPCGYHSIDKNGIIVRMNKTELDWLGYTENEVIGKMHVNRIITEEFANQREDNLKILLEKGHLDNIEFDMIRKNGSRFSVLMNSSVILDSRGNYVKNRSTVFDISQRKQLEEKLKDLNHHLMQVNEEKNRFIGMTTHDLKNPLNGIAGLTNLLKTHTSLSEEQEEYVKFIDESVRKMKHLITKLLDLNRLEQSGGIVQSQEVELQSFLAKIVAGYEESARKKHIKIILENPLNGLIVETDPMLLGQVVDNLLSNAIKFSGLKKKVWLRTERSNDRLFIEVEDQGPGILPEELPKLFGAFQRLSAKPTDGESSTGLGLSIVKELVRTLGGEIKVESEFGKGTKFRVILGNSN